MNANDTTVLILGAGPAGLSLARELSRRDISYLVLEKDAEVGSTFARMTASTTFGPWLNNTLPGSPVPWYRLLSRTTRQEYAAYLVDYARRHELQVATGVEVRSTHRREDGCFLVRALDGRTFTAPYLVNATGYFSKPKVPEYPGSASCRVPSLHSSSYRDPDTVRVLAGKARPKVLIVGSRLSAGEILQELHESGCKVELSHRSRIETWPSPFMETVLSPLTYLWEATCRLFDLGRPGNLRPRLRRGRQLELLRSGQVRLHPDILRLDGDCVHFVDQACDQYDVILYATGYQAAVDHLAPMITRPRVQDLESAEVPGCFFLGLIQGRTFRSEFLRGIREDAVYLGGVLASRVLDADSGVVVQRAEARGHAGRRATESFQRRAGRFERL